MSAKIDFKAMVRIAVENEDIAIELLALWFEKHITTKETDALAKFYGVYDELWNIRYEILSGKKLVIDDEEEMRRALNE
jgi:hypothetical protein